MSVWEYKVISSGKGGFATPALMESFLNQLGKDEWEIIHFHTPADNALAFSGLARRSTQRDWTLEDAVAAAARAEAEKLRTEFEAKFKGSAAGGGGPLEEKPETLAAEKANADDGLRKLRDTDRDQEHESEDEPAAETELDDWQKLAKEEELPSFFEAIQPLMRRNQRGAGMSVGVDHLAKKWGMGEDDIVGALKECGFVIPEDEDDPAAYLEYDGDLFWVNVNRRGEIWVNTKEKPRPVFKTVKAERFESAARPPGGLDPQAGSEPAPQEGVAGEGHSPSHGQPEPEPTSRPERPERAERGDRSEQPSRPDRPDRPERPDRHERQNDRAGGNQQRQNDPPKGANQPNKRGLPEGEDLLNRIKPLMRRARGGEGGSGSLGFLSRGLKCRDNELMAAFAALGLTLPGAQGETATEVVIGEALWWLSKDHRGGIWINARKPGTEKSASSEGSAPAGGARSPDALDEHAAPTHSEAAHETQSQPSAGNEPIAADGSGAPAETIAHAAAASEEAAISLSSEAPAMPAETQDGEQSHATANRITQPSAEPVSSVPPLIAQLRPLLKETRTGTLAGEIGKLAEGIGQEREALIAGLEGLGLTLPEKAREKPATVDFGGEPVWLSKNAKGELYFNAKPFREAAPERKPRKAKRPAAEDAPQAES
jgi:hypothetical protein